jgi:hypothetical protein
VHVTGGKLRLIVLHVCVVSANAASTSVQALYAHNTHLACTEVHQLQRVSEVPQLLPPSLLAEILKALPCTSLCRFVHTIFHAIFKDKL